MAKVGLRTEFNMETRTKYTKVNCVVQLSLDGQELPSMAVLGPALEEAAKMIQDRVTESYKEVPARVAEPVTEPVKVGDPVAATQATVVHTGLTNDKPVPPVPTPAQEEPVPFGSGKPWDIGKATQ